MKIYETKGFARWRQKQAILDDVLCTAVSEIERGLTDGNLGGNLYKTRVPAPGKGKRGSYRTLLAFKSKTSAFFVFGFSKNARGNITGKEERALKALAKELLGYGAKEIRKAIKANEILEVRCENEPENE
ncbi:MAG: type II toxin-antitoxin system RelE/ParE family toxin [Rhodospirillales bacterium]|nr:type II toxin-antitoxin system RelE/ParE family toxin [Rhodospirillales bacterium]